MNAESLLDLATTALDDLKAVDITTLDVRELTSITDYMVVCSGTSLRHVKSLADNVMRDAKQAGHKPLGIEGKDQADWILVDLGDVVVHVMQVQARAFFQLEKLWDGSASQEASEQGI